MHCCEVKRGRSQFSDFSRPLILLWFSSRVTSWKFLDRSSCVSWFSQKPELTTIHGQTHKRRRSPNPKQMQSSKVDFEGGGGEVANWDEFSWAFLAAPQWQRMKGGLAGRGVIQTRMWHFIQTWEDRLLVDYPHALHSRHGSERPEGPQGSHCPEGLDASSTQQGGSEVDERDLRLLVLLVFQHVISNLHKHCQCYGVSKAC